MVIGLTGLGVSLMLLVSSCATAPQTNAEKCAAMGGHYNTASRSCQMPSEAPRR
ncbi:MAG TPA: hypothetical protein VLZ09_01165 [Gaiellaceae bacterium]|nr:hypothetical protein [Gaiellaceae bacterium]